MVKVKRVDAPGATPDTEDTVEVGTHPDISVTPEERFRDMPSVSPTCMAYDLDGIEIPCSAYESFSIVQPHRADFSLEQNLYSSPWDQLDHVTELDGMVPGSTGYTFDPSHDLSSDISATHLQVKSTLPAGSVEAYVQDPDLAVLSYSMAGHHSPAPSNDSYLSHDVTDSYVSSHSPEISHDYDRHLGIQGRTSSPISSQSSGPAQQMESFIVHGTQDNGAAFYQSHQQQQQHYSESHPAFFQVPNMDPNNQHYHVQNNLNSKEMNATELISWYNSHPNSWSTKEVLDWLYYTADRSGLDCSRLRGESFRNITGSDLCLMGPDDFSRLEPTYGRHLYSQFRQLLAGFQFSVPTETSYLEIEATYPFNDMESKSNSADAQGQGHAKVQGHILPNDAHSQFPVTDCTETSGILDYGTHTHNQSTVETLLLQGYDYNTSDTKFEQAAPLQYNMEYLNDYHEAERHDYRRHSDIVAKYANGVIPVKRRPGRPRIKSLPTEQELQAQKDKKMKGQHLWEFIYDTLSNPLYNPQILKWENQSEGVFRFIQSESVAHLWGALKNNENMTYEKLSRAMRHYYKRGILERVEGRRLVYKFSRTTLDRMKDWKAKTHHH